MLDAVTQARELIRIVSSDSKLPRSVRRRAGELHELAARQPSLALEGLEELRQRVVPSLTSGQPTCAYARCVSVEAFWIHNLAQERRAVFSTSKICLNWLERQADPEAAAFRDVSPGNIVPARHSWLVPAADIAGLDGRGLRTRLKLGDGEPPYLVFVFPLLQLLAAGVQVREPRGLDAVPARHVQWSPGGVPDERIDQDIPYSALGGVQWRP